MINVFIILCQDLTMSISKKTIKQQIEKFKKSFFQTPNLPAWAQLTPRGRQETLSALSPEVWQCFAEAGLISSYSDEIVSWWDALAARARGRKSQLQLEIGRQGERLSIKYEEIRTGKKPAWQAIESNLAGYDIISIVDPSDYRKLQIRSKNNFGGSRSWIFLYHQK